MRVMAAGRLSDRHRSAGPSRSKEKFRDARALTTASIGRAINRGPHVELDSELGVRVTR
jgi:hypothetical protein